MMVQYVCFYVPRNAPLRASRPPRRRRCALPSSARAPRHRWYRCGRRGAAVGARRGPPTRQILAGRAPSLRCNARGTARVQFAQLSSINHNVTNRPNEHTTTTRPRARPPTRARLRPHTHPTSRQIKSAILHHPSTQSVGRSPGTRPRAPPNPFAAPVARQRQRQRSLRRASSRSRSRGCGQGRNARLAKAHAPSRAAATPPSSPPSGLRHRERDALAHRRPDGCARTRAARAAQARGACHEVHVRARGALHARTPRTARCERPI